MTDLSLIKTPAISKALYKDTDAPCQFYEQLRRYEQQWWQARQRLVVLKERQMFWYGDSSFMMWLLWQLVSYVVVALVLMLFNQVLALHFSLWQYAAVFVAQTLIFVVMLACKGRLAKQMQKKICQASLTCEQVLNQMVTLANNSIYPDIHAASPLSLQAIYERYESQLRLASLQHLIQKEVDAGRLMLKQCKLETHILPLELADEELKTHAGKMIYKSML